MQVPDSVIEVDNLCISILEFKLFLFILSISSSVDLCISILEFKWLKKEKKMVNIIGFMYFYIRI